MMKKIALLVFLSLTISSCFNENIDENKIKTNKENKIETLSGNIDIENKTNSGELIENNTGALETESGSIEDKTNKEEKTEKETLKEIIKNKEVVRANTGSITTDTLLDDVSENYDKEIEDEILKLFE